MITVGLFLLGTGLLAAAVAAYPDNVEPDTPAGAGTVSLLTSTPDAVAVAHLQAEVLGDGSADVTLRVEANGELGEWYAVAAGAVAPEGGSDLALSVRAPFAEIHDGQVLDLERVAASDVGVVRLELTQAPTATSPGVWEARWHATTDVLTKIGRGVRVATQPSLVSAKALWMNQDDSRRWDQAVSRGEADDAAWTELWDALAANAVGAITGTSQAAPPASLTSIQGANAAPSPVEIQTGQPIQSARIPYVATDVAGEESSAPLAGPVGVGATVSVQLPPGAQLVSAEGVPQTNGSLLTWSGVSSGGRAFIVTQVPAEVARADEGLFRAGLLLGFAVAALTAALGAVVSRVRDKPVFPH